MKITSMHNDLVKFWVSLKNKKVRDKERKFIVEGDHLIDEARKINLEINKEKLEEALLVPVIFLSTKTKEGVNELLDTIYHYNNREYIEILHTKKLQNYLKNRIIL